MPGLAPKLAKLLGTRGAGPIDVNAACAGFLYGLDQAVALIESGRVKLAVVVGAEALSRVTDPHDRGTAILFADGAAAVVVAADAFQRGCSKFVLASDGEHGDLLYAELEERLLRMEGQEVYRHAVARMVEATRRCSSATASGPSTTSTCSSSSGQPRIVETASPALGLPEEKVVLNVDLVANTSAASIPLALARAESAGRLARDDRRRSAAFAAGFVWGAGIVRWREKESN